MHLAAKLAGGAALTAMVAAAAYAGLVLDALTARSDLVERHAVGANVSMSLVEYNQKLEAMRKQYGERANTNLEFPGGRMTVLLDGTLIEEKHIPTKFSDAVGLFVVGPRGKAESTFPFRLDPTKAPDPDTRDPDVLGLKNRFGKGFPARYLAFKDHDWLRDSCFSLEAQDLGFGGLGRLLRMQSGTYCLVFWRGPNPGSMLVGVTLAEGDPWMRPFTRRICRALMANALARLAAIDREPPPDYAGCILVDRPDRSGAQEVLQTHVFEVRRDRTLARID